MDQVEHVAAKELLGTIAEHPLDGAAGVFHQAFAIEHGDHVQRVGKERLKVPFARLQPFFGAELAGDVAIHPDDADLSSVEDDRTPQHRDRDEGPVLAPAGRFAAHRPPLGGLLTHMGRVAHSGREDLVDGPALDLALLPPEQAGELAGDPAHPAAGIEQGHCFGRVFHQLLEVGFLHPQGFRDLPVLDHEAPDQDDGGEREQGDQEPAEVDREAEILQARVTPGPGGPQEENEREEEEQGRQDCQAPVAQAAEQDHGPREGGHAGGERDEDEGTQSILCAGRRYVGGDTNL